MEARERSYSWFGNGTSRAVVIMEPCNYASNIAYYHAAKRACDYPEWKNDVNF